MEKKKLFLIDGQNLIYRAFYALPALKNSKGMPTGAIYGFANMVLKFIKEETVEYAAVAFDLPGKTFRHDLYVGYKATRQKPPEDLLKQIPYIKAIVNKYNICIIEKSGFEADDILGTLARKFKNEFDVRIVSGDKDILQLVNDSVWVINKKPNEIIVYDPEKVRSVYNVEPAAIIDILALSGDVSDNIPGVKGIGEKTAAKLINEFGNIENILKNLDKLQPSVKEKINSHIEDLEISRKLTKIDENVPLDLEAEDLKVGQPDNQSLAKLFEELEFTKLLKDIGSQGDLFEDNGKTDKEEEKREVLTDVVVVRSEKETDLFKKEIEKTGIFAIEGNNDRENTVFCILTDKKVFFFDTVILKSIKPVLENKLIEKIGYDLKEKLNVLCKIGIRPEGFDFDLKLALYLLDSDGFKTKLPSEVIRWEDSSADKEVFDIFKLKEKLSEELKEKGMFELFQKVEMPLTKVLSDMELSGIKIDSEYMFELGKRMEIDIDKVSREIYGLAGEEFNINSPKVLARILFEKLKYTPVRKTKTGFSTDVDVLEKLAPKYEIAEKVLSHRQLAKLKSTYVDTLPKLVDADTKRIHSSFNQTGTSTGRLSSSEPNMQNIPVKTEIGRQIRRAFIAEEGKIFISADYSQIELRVLAHLSEDENLVESFKNNQDIHLRTASEIFGLPVSQIDDTMRSRAKVVNFGIVYGMSGFGLAQELGIYKEEAQQYIDTYFLKYRGVAKYIKETLEKAEQDGFVRTILGRIRYTPDISSQNRNMKQFAERIAVNSPIQGSASDIIKLAMVNIFRKINEKGLGSKLLLQIHDELLFEVVKEEEAQMLSLLKKK